MDFDNIGNIEFIESFDFIFNEVYGPKFERLEEYLSQEEKEEMWKIYLHNGKQILKKFPNMFSFGKTKKEILPLYFEEAKKRGLKIDKLTDKLDTTEEYKRWYDYMIYDPTFVREISAINFPGGDNVDVLGVSAFDMPVRESCSLLSQKGYVTYWSSANAEDISKRTGHVVKDKNVAYILIQYNCLTPELQEQLLLDGNNNVWGIAEQALKNGGGKLYGIWAEITSENMTCKELSDNLVKVAKSLPNAINVEPHRFTMGYSPT